MVSRKLIPLILLILLLTLFVGVRSAAADSSHARIIRLSLVQGDVRYARETHGDPLADSNAGWETAGLNLPIRQGYVVATDNGRAEVEFENGAMAFLREDTVLQFFDLSLKDGALTTRLVLLQGSASFYVNPAQGDYFSVTGGDFTVEASGRATFRVDNYSDGSTVEDARGRLTVLHGDQITRLDKGQSFSIKAGDDHSVSIGRVPAEDEFDRWVSGRIDSVAAATTAALQYTDSPYYTPGFASLYSYGSFFNCGGYGYGWRPFGVGAGWSPFMDGQWILDPAFGWTWISFQPWGWAPYHYGGWMFDSGCGGWFYSPPLYYGYYPRTIGRRPPKRVNPPRPIFHPATAVFVRNNGKVGLIPMHPLDQKGKTSLNFGHGVFWPEGPKGPSDPIMASGQKWETLKSAPKDAFTNHLQPTAPPGRVSRTMIEGTSGARVVSMNKDSSIGYDAREHRFVNSNTGPATSSPSEKQIRIARQDTEAGAANGGGRNAAAGNTVRAARGSTPPSPPRNITPPPAPRYSGGTRGSSAGPGSSWGSTRSSGASSAGSPGHTSSAPAPAPAPRASSGGRPH